MPKERTKKVSRKTTTCESASPSHLSALSQTDLSQTTPPELPQNPHQHLYLNGFIAQPTLQCPINLERYHRKDIEERMRLHIADPESPNFSGNWRPCVKGLPDPEIPGSGCVGTLLPGPGAPLEESRSLEEQRQGKPTSLIPRMCIACEILAVHHQVTSSLHKQAAAILATDPSFTVQPWEVYEHEWNHTELLGPTAKNGVLNGLVSPFPRYQASLICELRRDVSNR
jgi:hypothetical protein